MKGQKRINFERPKMSSKPAAHATVFLRLFLFRISWVNVSPETVIKNSIKNQSKIKLGYEKLSTQAISG